MFCKQICSRLVSGVVRHNYSAIRWKSQVRMTKQLMKMLNKGPKKKTWYSQPANMDTAGMSQQNKRKRGPSEGQRRRAVQVGNVLYEYIVQMINSGEICPQLADMAVNIDRVSVVPDFSAINVHWLATGGHEDDRIETLLKQNSGKLRYILTSYHLLGHIPVINFIKDEREANILQVENLLNIADYGPDYEPAIYTTQVRPWKKVPGKRNIMRDFSKMSLENTDYHSYPGILTVTDTGSVVLEDAGKTFDSESSKKDETTKVGQSFTQKEEKSQQSETIVDSFTAKETVTENQSSAFERDNSENISEENKKHTKDFSLLEGVKLRNDLYNLQHDSLMSKLLMKKRRIKHRASEDTLSFISEESRDSKTAEVTVPDYSTFLRKRKKMKRLKGKVPYTVNDYLRNEGKDFWNILPSDQDDANDYYDDDYSDDEYYIEDEK